LIFLGRNITILEAISFAALKSVCLRRSRFELKWECKMPRIFAPTKQKSNWEIKFKNYNREEACTHPSCGLSIVFMS